MHANGVCKFQISLLVKIHAESATTCTCWGLNEHSDLKQGSGRF